MKAKDTQAKASNAADRGNKSDRVDNIDRVNRVSKVLNVSNDSHTRHPKHGWEVKKLGEVGTIIGGSTPKTSEPSYWNGEHFWVTPAELDGSKYISSTSRTITNEGVKSAHLQLLPPGTILLSSRAPIGKVTITRVPMYSNQGFKNLICADNLYNEYAYWFLYHNTEYLNSLGTGATFKEISKRIVEQIPIPIPPMEEQERIVGELDCLSGVIERKREQLKQLDALAQSIFYNMFGDPITNEKGWEVKKLREVCEDKKKIFRASKKCALDDVINYIDISAIDNINNVINIPTPYIFEEAPSRAQQVVQLGDVIVSMVRPNLKNIAIVNCNYDNLIASSGFCVLRARKEITIPFLFYIVKSDAFTMYLMDRVSGANYPAVRESDITDYISIIPPITLQQEFADKIEAIEKQKELLKRSIKEVETLFDARMDYYFGDT